MSPKYKQHTHPIYFAQELNNKLRFGARLSRMYYILAFLMIICLGFINICVAKEIDNTPTLNSNNAQANNGQQFTGKAYNKHGKLLYTESYNIHQAETLVVYKSPNGEILAAKSLQYTQHKPYRPNITIYQHNDHSTLTLTDNNHTLELKQTDKHNYEEVIRSNAIRPFKSELITDEAFNRYIQNNWKTIQAQEELVIHFTIAQHAKIFRVKLSESDNETCRALGYQCLSLKPNNWILRLLVSEAIIGYDEDLQLRYFYGPANSLANISRQTVSIHYQPASQPNLAEQLSLAH